MARLQSWFEKIRNSFLLLIGILIGVQPTIASTSKPAPTIPERLAAVRAVCTSSSRTLCLMRKKMTREK